MEPMVIDEVKSLGRILDQISKLSPAGKEYLRSRLSDLSLVERR